MHAESMQCILYTYVLSGLKALSMVYQGRRKQLKSGPASYTEAAQRAKKISLNCQEVAVCLKQRSQYTSRT